MIVALRLSPRPQAAAAVARLVEAHLSFAREMACRVARSRPGLDRFELESVALRALWRSAQTFKEQIPHGAPFAAYASRLIRQRLAGSVRDQLRHRFVQVPLPEPAARTRRNLAVSPCDYVRVLEWPERLVLRLLYQEDYGLREVAELLGICHVTVWRRQQTALRRLRKAVLRTGALHLPLPRPPDVQSPTMRRTKRTSSIGERFAGPCISIRECEVVGVRMPPTVEPQQQVLSDLVLCHCSRVGCTVAVGCRVCGKCDQHCRCNWKPPALAKSPRRAA